MQNQNQIFEDFSRLMSSIAGTMAGAGREAEARMKDKLRDLVGGDDWISRDEFDALRAMVDELRHEVETLRGASAKADTK